MKILTRSWGRYVLVIPMLIAALAITYFANLTTDINHTLLEEKFLEKQLELDLIDNLVDQLIIRDEDWGIYDYQSLLNDSIELLDAQAYTFAALYDEALTNLSHRTGSYSDLYDPFAGTNFRAEVLANARGNYISPYKPTGEPERDMHIYYRWVPTDTTLRNRYLTVVAISEYSISNHAAEWIGWGAMALVGTVTALNIALVVLMSRLGVIYEQRRGDKWRGRIEE